MKRIKIAVLTILAVAALALYAPPVQAQSPYAYQIMYPVSTFTAASQTGRVITLGRAYKTGSITLVGTALTTCTVQVLGSADGGTTYFPIGMWAQAVPGTIAVSETATANALYQVNLAGLTHIKLATTSGTFTGTSITMLLTAAPY